MIRVALKTFRAFAKRDLDYALFILPFQFAWVFVTVGWAWLTTTRKQRDAFYQARRPICELCPLFDHFDETCGTIGTFVVDQSPPVKVGCWCHIPTAARIPGKTCWKTERGLPGGWP